MTPAPQPQKGSSPIIVANIGSYSGPAASAIAPLLEGVQVWLKSINARGGINGHGVKLVVYDDGGDTARHRAQVQDAVERQRVIAFIANGEQITGPGSVEYLNTKRIPVVGTGSAYTWAESSPMYFPQQSEGYAGFFTAIASVADQVIPRGKTKIGDLACVEAQPCTELQNMIIKSAKALGLEDVYHAKASLAQPDFTAECLSAQRAGAEILFIGLDSNSVSRVAAACARQQYRPIFATMASIISERFKDDANLQGIVGASNVFPWFQTSTPATTEYRNAMSSFGGGTRPGVGTATGWTAGKLFEAAAANMPEPPTTEALLDGLWSIHDIDLGGLTYPLTFVRDQPAPQKACWFNLTVKDQSWQSPDQFKLRCQPWAGKK